MIIHNVGNKVKGESLEISTEICDANNEVTNQYLKQFFFSTFKFDVTYRFVHETDIAMNEIYNYVKHIFENPSEFYEQSVNIAKHLYEVSVHPNIKAGELYIVYLQNCIIDDNVTDAIGIYKSESKDYYLQVKVTIAFPDYNSFEHREAVLMAKSSFENADFVNNIEVITYKPDFRDEVI